MTEYIIIIIFVLYELFHWIRAYSNTYSRISRKTGIGYHFVRITEEATVYIGSYRFGWQAART